MAERAQQLNSTMEDDVSVYDISHSQQACSNTDTNDLVCVAWKSDEEVVQCLESRFMMEKYYTWAGIALIAMNPCVQVEHLYSEEMKCLYNTSSVEGHEEVPPHVYAVAARAQYKLLNSIGSQNQVIIISGDSGSGKTYTAWHLLNFLATTSSQNSEVSKELIWQICCSMPLLSAFGNAQTMCNNNSSRFGKLLQLQHSNGCIQGAYFQTYLLEKTRIASQPKNERNFHIFHQLLAGLQESDMEDFYLSRTRSYKIVPSSKTQSDANGFLETENALIALGISAETKLQVFQTLACILHLGNISFHKSSTSDAYNLDLDNEESCNGFESACKLLGLDQICLMQLLTTTIIMAQTGLRCRRTVYHKPAMSQDDCTWRRDSFMRFLYERLFLWLVAHINLQVAVSDTSSLLGILDIYGFEAFHYNSLEQLCINYANERLQLFFTKDFLAQQRDLLFGEELSCDLTCNEESFDRVVLLDGSHSIFSVLNEESVLQRHSSDNTVCNRLISTLRGNKYLTMPRCTGTNEFTVKHFAGNVNYNVHKMLQKNMDKIPVEFIDTLAACNNTFIHKLLQVEKMECNTSVRKNTVLTKFKNSVDNLCKLLAKADSQYIRCIKANEHFLPKVVDTNFLQKQLQASGLLEIIPLSQQYLPFRMKYSLFQQRYKSCVKKREIKLHKITERDSYMEIVADIVKAILGPQIIGQQAKFGQQSLFLTKSALLQLEWWRNWQRLEACCIIQTAWRKHWQRKKLASSQFPGNFPSACATVQTNESFSEEKCNVFVKITDKMNVTSSTDFGDTFRTVYKSRPRPETKHFIFYFGDGIISKRPLSQVPIRFHIRQTCLPFSHMLPQSELAHGLQDAL